MRSLHDAQDEVLGSVPRLGGETVELANAWGRVTAEPITAGEPVPPFDNSAMDGYAVRGDDVAEAGAMLRVVAEVPAGAVAEIGVGPGEAIKIMTGAPMPKGADTIVKVEDTERLDDVVHIDPSVERGTSVRAAGSDIEVGGVVFEKGTRLLDTHMAVLASLGAVRPSLARRPRVSLFSTGDELTTADAAVLRPGQIRDSNRVMLGAMLREVALVMDEGRVADDPVALRAAFGRAVAGSDAIVTSGGVSMGDHDHVRRVLADMGEVGFWKVAIKPAKPFAFGTVGGVPLFGLPGNPVSAAIAYEQLVRPALLSMQGAVRLFRPRVRAIAGEKIHSDSKRLEFLRVVLEVDDRGKVIVRPSGGQGSHMLGSFAAADALAVIPVGVEEVKAGQGLDIELFRNPETRRWMDG